MFTLHVLLWSSQCVVTKLFVDANTEGSGRLWYRWCTSVVSKALILRGLVGFGIGGVPQS